MVTGASTADLALVLADARRGITEQSRRHLFLAALLRVPHLVLAVNKMDLVDYAAAAFAELKAAAEALLARLEFASVTCIPISALHGDNVVERSSRMPWYDGPVLLEHLERVPLAADRHAADLRFAVQLVIRPLTASHPDYRGYAGQVVSGVLRAGDRVQVLPAGLSTRVQAIEVLDGPLAEAFAPLSVTVRLEDDLDVARGDLLCHPDQPPLVGQDLEAYLCWLAPTPLQPNGRYALKHTTRAARAVVKSLRYRVDVNTLARDTTATTLGLNDIGRVALRTTTPLPYDAYAHNRATGSFILIDEATNHTVAAGMLLDPRAADAVAGAAA
jgi:bifunctional enzyme CysN/CysC